MIEWTQVQGDKYTKPLNNLFERMIMFVRCLHRIKEKRQLFFEQIFFHLGYKSISDFPLSSSAKHNFTSWDIFYLTGTVRPRQSCPYFGPDYSPPQNLNPLSSVALSSEQA